MTKPYFSPLKIFCLKESTKLKELVFLMQKQFFILFKMQLQFGYKTILNCTLDHMAFQNKV